MPLQNHVFPLYIISTNYILIVDEAMRMDKDLLMFKVDFEKAYDSVDLKYIDMVMANMHFPTLWRKWISECVDTAKAAV